MQRGALDRFRTFCSGLLANRRFRNWASAFPLTRPIARRRARELFDLCAGFVYSQILLACVRLKLFEILAEGPQTAAVLSGRIGLPADATSKLLEAAVSLRLIERRGDERFGLGALGAPLAGNTAITAMVEHHALLYSDLRDPVALLREGAHGSHLAAYWAYAGAEDRAALPQERVASYSALMSASQPLVADEILDCYALRQHRCLLDVGGGEGTFLAAVAFRAPQLQLMLFDLPAVAERARARFAADGLSLRARAIGGDFLCDPLPQGADIISLIRVLHDHDDAAAMSILRAARRALPAGGTLLLAEPMSATPGAEPIGAAYFGFYLLAMGRGRPRSAAQISKMIVAAGFAVPRLIPTRMPLQTSLLVARVPRSIEKPVPTIVNKT